jgi:hypothetical protein
MVESIDAEPTDRHRVFTAQFKRQIDLGKKSSETIHTSTLTGLMAKVALLCTREKMRFSVNGVGLFGFL